VTFFQGSRDPELARARLPRGRHQGAAGIDSTKLRFSRKVLFAYKTGIDTTKQQFSRKLLRTYFNHQIMDKFRPKNYMYEFTVAIMKIVLDFKVFQNYT
jgi:hypothetical protein